jgi:hypothetical protein
MTQLKLIEANFPVYFQCLCVPVEWRRSIKRQTSANSLRSVLLLASTPHEQIEQQDGDLLEVERVYPVTSVAGAATKGHEFFRATSFDPWEKRAEFFRLEQGNTDALLIFLRSIGLFERPRIMDDESPVTKTLLSAQDGLLHEAPYVSQISEEHIWAVRRAMRGSLKALEQHSGEYDDFQVRFLRSTGGKSRLVLTTSTFFDALLLTLSVDQLQGAKVRKCARPDCGVLFSTTGGHKRKYCAWYCGHIESVRRSRREIRKRKGITNGKR